MENFYVIYTCDSVVNEVHCFKNLKEANVKFKDLCIDYNISDDLDEIEEGIEKQYIESSSYTNVQIFHDVK